MACRSATTSRNDILAEMETDKRAGGCPRRAPGVIAALHGNEGDPEVGNVLVTYAGGAVQLSRPRAQEPGDHGTHAAHAEELDEPSERTEDDGTVVGK